ncbi:aminotransferase class IV [Clostridioides difficile]|nr:aminotransferase class IV [Clostridioides difficile]
MKNNVGFDSSLSKFGIGLFETIRVKNGIAVDLDIHIERMLSSINCLDLDINYTKDFLINEIVTYIKKKMSLIKHLELLFLMKVIIYLLGMFHIIKRRMRRGLN